MKKVFLKIPSIDDLKYRKKWLKDPKSMIHNIGYDVDIKGYNREDGTITKTDEEIVEWYHNWVNKEPDKYFAYIYSTSEDEPLGEIYYQYDGKVHSMGVFIRNEYRGKGYSYLALLELEKIAFEKNNISELSDIIPINRVAAIKSFEKAGFTQTEMEITDKRLGKEQISRQLLITKEMYFKKVE